MQTYDTGVLTRGLDALVNTHDLAVNIVTGSEQSLVYLSGAYRTVDRARGADLDGDSERYTLECLGSLLGVGFHLSQLVSLLTQILGVDLQSAGSSQDSLASGDEIVAAVAVLHFHNVVLETKIDDIFFQYNLHN